MPVTFGGSAMRQTISYMLVLAFLSGCGGTTPRAGSQSGATAPPPPPGDVSGEPLVDKVVELWLQGEKDEAVALFLEIKDWSLGGLASKDSVLEVSEQDFALLSASRQDDLYQSLPAIKNLCRHVVALAKKEASANPAKATALLKQVEYYGKWLDVTNRSLILQQMGKVAKKMSSKELEQLPEE